MPYAKTIEDLTDSQLRDCEDWIWLQNKARTAQAVSEWRKAKE